MKNNGEVFKKVFAKADEAYGKLKKENNLLRKSLIDLGYEIYIEHGEVVLRRNRRRSSDYITESLKVNK